MHCSIALLVQSMNIMSVRGTELGVQKYVQSVTITGILGHRLNTEMWEDDGVSNRTILYKCRL